MFIDSPLGISKVVFTFVGRGLSIYGSRDMGFSETVPRLSLTDISEDPCDWTPDKMSAYLTKIREEDGLRGFFLVRERLGPASGFEIDGPDAGSECECSRCHDAIYGDVQFFTATVGDVDVAGGVGLYNEWQRRLWEPIIPLIPFTEPPLATWDMSMISSGAEKSVNSTTGEITSPGSCGDQYLRLNGGPYWRGDAAFTWTHPHGMRYKSGNPLDPSPAPTEITLGGAPLPSFVQIASSLDPLKFQVPILSMTGSNPVIVTTARTPGPAYETPGTPVLETIEGTKVANGEMMITPLSPNTFSINVTAETSGGREGTVTSGFPYNPGIEFTDANDKTHIGYRAAFTGPAERQRRVESIRLVRNRAQVLNKTFDFSEFQASVGGSITNEFGEDIEIGGAVVFGMRVEWGCDMAFKFKAGPSDYLSGSIENGSITYEIA